MDPGQVKALSLWEAGGEFGVCSTEVLHDYIHQHVPATPHAQNMVPDMPGPVQASRRINTEVSKTYMVSDPNPPGQKLPELKKRKLCEDLHPGLCRTKDALELDFVNHICTNINTYFADMDKWSAIGRVFRFTFHCEKGEEAVHEPIGSHGDVMVGAVRKARPKVQHFVAPDIMCEYALTGEPTELQFHREGMNAFQIFPTPKYIVLRCRQVMASLELTSITDIKAVTFRELYVDVLPVESEELRFKIDSPNPQHPSLFENGKVLNLWPVVRARTSKPKLSATAAREPLLNAAIGLLTRDQAFRNIDRVRKRLGIPAVRKPAKASAKDVDGPVKKSGPGDDDEGKSANESESDSDSDSSDEEYEKKTL